MIRDPRDRHTAAVQVKKEQHIVGHQPVPGDDLGGEEVTAGQSTPVGAEEVLPSRVLLALGCGWNAVPAKKVTDRLV